VPSGNGFGGTAEGRKSGGENRRENTQTIAIFRRGRVKKENREANTSAHFSKKRSMNLGRPGREKKRYERGEKKRLILKGRKEKEVCVEEGINTSPDQVQPIHRKYVKREDITQLKERLTHHERRRTGQIKEKTKRGRKWILHLKKTDRPLPRSRGEARGIYWIGIVPLQKKEERGAPSPIEN